MIGYIYVLECCGFYKIGWSTNPRTRLAVAKNFNPYPVQLVAYYEADSREERQVHERFKASMINGREWFKGDGEVLDWTRRIGSNRNESDLDAWFKRNRGSKVRLAKKLGLTPGSISQWDIVPAHHVASVEEFTGIRREILRPDIFVRAA